MHGASLRTEGKPTARVSKAVAMEVAKQSRQETDKEGKGEPFSMPTSVSTMKKIVRWEKYSRKMGCPATQFDCS